MARGAGDKTPDKIETIVTPIGLEYDYTPGTASTTFLRGMRRGSIVGQRCPECQNVYVPPRGSCPRCGVPTEGEVPVEDTGTVTTFTVVHIPIPGSELEPPFVSAVILLDGADQTTLHLVAGCDPHEVRIGMRVRARWKPEAEWDYSFENIRYFEPTGEPDVPLEGLPRSG
jgi:uncharacterized OB-fold protein